MNDGRITIREVVNDVGIAIGSYHDIFLDVMSMARA